jgi:hypothetical protein
VAGGTAPFTYLWRKDGSPLAGATAATLTLNNVTAASAGGYDVVVTNALGSTPSAIARLTVTTANTAPVITRQPANLALLVGRTATFTVAATGTPAPAYQWRKNGVAINGATSATLTLANINAGDAGAYSAVATNSVASVTSNDATLAVIRRSFAGVYFGTLGSGGTFALLIGDDNTGMFLAYAPGSRTAFSSRTVAVDDDGHFRFTTSTTSPGAGTAAESDIGAPIRAAAANDLVIEGTISSTGTLTASASTANGSGGTTVTTLTGNKTPDTGNAAAGFYQASAPGSSAQTLAIVSPSGQALVLTQNGSSVDGGSGTVDSSGKLTVTTSANQTIAVNVSAANASLNATVTDAQGRTTTFTGFNAASAAVADQRVLNISARTTAGGAAQPAIVGFVISGLESKTVLIRAIGPTLRDFGLTTALTAPKLELLRLGASAALASNTGWSTAANPAEISATAARIGAFPLGSGSADSVILTTLAPGSYTAVVTAADGRAGTSLLEVYDVSGGSAAQRLANLSTRASTGAGEATLTAGVVVTGSAPKRVLLRAAGPALAQFGVTGVLARPQLTLTTQAGATIATNAGWSTSGDAAAIAEAAANTGAFAFASGSADAALIVNLAPGAYTAQVTGVGGTNGVALIEVYEVP